MKVGNNEASYRVADNTVQVHGGVTAAELLPLMFGYANRPSFSATRDP